ncbi:MAG: NADP-dependent malic enzyme [Planctomycetes bacterium]|nr:NADP-dependent malic enzyme [Planctomycetota bacterium]
MDFKQMALQVHKDLRGKLEVVSRIKVSNKEDLSIAYTPGVAEPCLEIQKDVNNSYVYTRRWNLVLVVTDGTAVLGLGDIGPEAGMPVMEGKCVLFKEFGNVDAFPLCVRSKNVDDIVNTVKLISGSFGGVNLEDISAPRCFEIERRLKQECDIPIFHDDQHGTAIVTLGAAINALKLVGKDFAGIRVAVSGAGAAAVSVTKLLMRAGVTDITLVDRRGIIHKDRDGLDDSKRELAEFTNPLGLTGTLADAMRDADMFIGLSSPNLVSEEMVKSMSPNPIVFPMANPVPEIDPEAAKRAGAAVIGTGRSDYKNQINNVLAFPGIFRGALDVRASDINEEMKLAAAKALADLVGDRISPDFIVPDAFDPAVGPAVAKAVADAARASGVARV